MNHKKMNQKEIDATYKTYLIPRKKDSHKGTYGKVLIVAYVLTLLSENMSWIKKYKGSIALTPHMGEMSRFMKCSLEEIADAREKTALGFTADHKVTTVLPHWASIYTAERVIMQKVKCENIV